VERLRFIDPRGHHDFLNEIRWSHQEAIKTKDGIDIETLELDETSKAGLSIPKTLRPHIIWENGIWGMACAIP